MSNGSIKSASTFNCICVFVLNQDLKANESRLRDINKVASELESEGLMAEEAPMVQAQVSHQFGSLVSMAAGVGNHKFIN